MGVGWNCKSPDRRAREDRAGFAGLVRALGVRGVYFWASRALEVSFGAFAQTSDQRRTAPTGGGGTGLSSRTQITCLDSTALQHAPKHTQIAETDPSRRSAAQPEARGNC